jgi:hypothetical protein
MRKVLIFLTFLSTLAYSAPIENPLIKEFPYGLLTDDFGILTRRDLKINTCIAEPTPLLQKRWSSYPYWQCFELQKSKITCEKGKYDIHEKATMSMMVFSGVRNTELHEFISRRPIPLDSCATYRRNWRKLTNNEKYVCISGESPSKKIEKSHTKWTWIFRRYKTKKGCDSYFYGECNQVPRCD